ncbi:hypothetical protein CHARACLAT_005766 [Characodon lateralis]|uniref:Uncharacterized protein n=1 Tax=Characodon lateralis TaxID=208331 RepID=A0ABU7DYL2_9TELE|nr:hypothetical protein [Characodon lateralis]
MEERDVAILRRCAPFPTSFWVYVLLKHHRGLNEERRTLRLSSARSSVSFALTASAGFILSLTRIPHRASCFAHSARQ